MKPSLLKRIGTLLKYVLCIVLLPVAIGIAIYRYVEFRKYTTILKNSINNNDDLFNYLNKYEFMPDWLGRLYSVQPIPKEFRDFTDDELYDITMRSMLPLMKLLEKSVLIDVVSVIISRNTNELYTVVLTPYCWPKFVNAIMVLTSSIAFTIISAIIYFCIV